MDQPTGLAAFQPNAQTPSPQQSPPSQPKRISENVYMTDFNDEAVSKYDFELYQGKANEIHHIQLLLPGPNPVGRGRSHFHDKLKGGGILCRSEYVLSSDGRQEMLAKQANCCRWLGASAPRFAVLIVQYNTLPSGQLITTPFGWNLKLWRFGVQKYKDLQAINRDWPLTDHDLTIACSEEKFQKMTIGAKKGCILRHPNFPAADKQTIENWARASVDKLPNEIGRKFENDAQLQQYLQLNGVVVARATPGPVPTMVPQDQPVTNFEDIIGMIVPAARE